jgi:thioredoxin reductase
VLVIDAASRATSRRGRSTATPACPDPLPSELRRRLLEQAQGAGAEMREGEVVRVDGEKDDSRAAADGDAPRRRIILAYGLRDYLPDIEGIDELYGTSVFHCPDCDGPPSPTPASASSAGTAMAPTSLCTCGTGAMTSRCCPTARSSAWTATRVLVLQEPASCRTGIARVVGHGGNLTQASSTTAALRLDALFFHLGSEPRCELAEQLGCELDDDGYVASTAARKRRAPACTPPATSPARRTSPPLPRPRACAPRWPSTARCCLPRTCSDDLDDCRGRPP